MKTTAFCLFLLCSSFSVQALPLVSVKEQIRDELWHQGLKKKAPKNRLTRAQQPRLNEELYRALVKYQL